MPTCNFCGEELVDSMTTKRHKGKTYHTRCFIELSKQQAQPSMDNQSSRKVETSGDSSAMKDLSSNYNKLELSVRDAMKLSLEELSTVHWRNQIGHLVKETKGEIKDLSEFIDKLVEQEFFHKDIEQRQHKGIWHVDREYFLWKKKREEARKVKIVNEDTVKKLCNNGELHKSKTVKVSLNRQRNLRNKRNNLYSAKNSKMEEGL